MKQLRHRFKLLALFLFALFAALMLYGAYNIANYGTRWFSSSHNPRVAAQKENVIAGDILDRNGVVLASISEDGQRVYHPDAAVRSAVVHTVGSPDNKVADSVESFMTEYLYGFRSNLPDLIRNLFSGGTRKGDNVALTLDSTLCANIPRYYASHPVTGGKNGAAVVMNWKTGELLAVVSLPSFDPADAGVKSIDETGQPYWNRVTRGRYPPGSTFKIITAAAALRAGMNTGDDTFWCSGSLQVDGQHTIRDFSGEVHESEDLRKAFKLSCNPYFSDLALRLTDARLRGEAERFGFNDNVLFRDLVVENSVYPSGIRSDYEVAMSGLGQSTLLATPLHMCLVAAGIANGGVMMEPRLIREVKSPTGSSVLAFSSEAYRTACTPETAAVLQQYMKDVVQDGGSGWRARISGMDIRGKTGTAESSLDGKDITYGWFIGYSADESLPYALCVLTEDIEDGQTGGTTSALVAKDIFGYLLQINGQ
ncbi:MAG: hypothetical protein MJ142_06820 [Clostridia bacterium]|nr:hypothetical protein [Clostridia bacterium]